jgi:threonine dehydrogenase-like Zn-dependent dehydrogenase
MTASMIRPGQTGVKMESREVSSPGSRELKVRVEATGLCGTDLQSPPASTRIADANENPIEFLTRHHSVDRGVVSSKFREGVLQPYCNRADTG